jgi:SNF2 family DNA or RNA helicase
LNPNQTPLQISSTDLQLDSEGLAMAVQSLALDAIAKPQSRSFRPGVAKPATVSVPLRTRIKPPGDIVRLRDRLFYALQPPLEMMVDTGELHFPFEPFPYQYAGIAFLFPRYAAVLADEMGLGKTMQAISAIRMLIRSGVVRSVLLICPKPLVTNWKREFSMWAPEIPLDIIEGDQARREFQWQQPMAVKVANYELMTRDKEMVASLGLQFDLVVLDEAQRIKNRSSATSQAVRDLDRTRSWALTGTPVENSPEDLVGIFEFVSPGYLRSEMKPRAMGKATKDYVLRRTKDMVLTDLPPKMYRDAELDLSASQWESYERAESGGVLRLSEMGDELTIQHVFELVLRLKQVCNFDPVTDESSKLDRLEADMEEVAASGKKAIVFSQWVKTLKKIKDRLGRFGALEYHGKIPSRKREQVIDQFRNDDSQHVILMSYGAGSVGLNLQFCEYVFLFDRWWNPAVEDQAINRAHRIGAAGPVTVTRMLCLNTIEQRIHAVLEEKRELFATIFSETDAPASMGLSQEDIFGLFNLKTGKRNAA